MIYIVLPDSEITDDDLEVLKVIAMKLMQHKKQDISIKRLAESMINVAAYLKLTDQHPDFGEFEKLIDNPTRGDEVD